MQFLAITLGLAVAVSAVDVRLHFNYGCSGGAAVCTNINPGVCCGAPTTPYASIGFYGIDPNWRNQYQGYVNGRCRNFKNLDTGFGINFKCLDRGEYTGGEYYFINRNSARHMAPRELGHEDGATKECTRPDMFISEDGTKYSLVELSDAEIAELVEASVNGTVPDSYKALEISA